MEMVALIAVRLSLSGHVQKILCLLASVCQCEVMVKEKKVKARNETTLTMMLRMVVVKNELSKTGGID